MTKPKNKPKPRRETARPIPEMVDPKTDWVVRDSPAGTASLDRRSGLLTAPLGITPRDRQAKNHEMLHLRLSPKNPPRLPAEVDPLAYMCAEDYRINHRGVTEFGITQDVRNTTDVDIERWKQVWSMGGTAGAKLLAASTLLAAYGTHDDLPVLDAIREVFEPEDYAEIAYAVERATDKIYYSKKPSHKRSIEAAHMLTDMLRPFPEEEGEESGSGSGSSSAAKDQPSEAEIAKKTREGLSKLKDSEAVREHMREEGKPSGHVPTPEEIEDNWGTMTIKRPPLPLILPGKMRARRFRATDSGSVFRYPNRYLADRHVFAARTVREGGCSLLIDTSGSMSLTSDDILQIMEYMPAALIAAYDGGSGSGVLRILGRKGRRAAARDIAPIHGGNCIDGPALAWLAKQPGPRYWVSDGAVTGRGDGSSTKLIVDCIRICEAARIMRIPSTAEVIEMFAQFRARR